LPASLDALFFDLDGTLIDTQEGLALSLNFALERLGRPTRTLDEVRGFIGDGARLLVSRGLGAGTSEDLVSEGLRLFRTHYFEHCADNAALYPGVRDVLSRQRSKALAVVTNKPDAPTRTLLKAFGLDLFFRDVMAGDSVPALKPSPEPLLESARRLGVSAGRTLMVGDSPVDVQAGKAAGMLTCAVSYGYRSRKELEAAGPDFFVDRFAELEKILEVRT
jgi:phosphoglycolate phosphatase